MYLLGLCAVLRFNINQGYIIFREKQKHKQNPKSVLETSAVPRWVRGGDGGKSPAAAPSYVHVRTSNSLLPRDLRCSLRRWLPCVHVLGYSASP